MSPAEGSPPVLVIDDDRRFAEPLHGARARGWIAAVALTVETALAARARRPNAAVVTQAARPRTGSRSSSRCASFDAKMRISPDIRASPPP
jgi:ActR/RegA family two-component response regulator